MKGVPSRPPRRAFALVLIPIGVLVVASWIADAAWPALIREHPLLLMTLSARNRYLAMVSDRVDPFAFFLVGGLRLLVADPFFYLIGHWWGDRAVDWLERRHQPTRRAWESVEQAFGKIGPLMVFLAANNLVCAMAGSTHMAPRRFVVYNATGTVARLTVIWWLGNRFSDYLEAFREFVGENLAWIMPLSILAVAVVVVRELRRSASEIRELRVLSRSSRVQDADLGGEERAEPRRRSVHPGPDQSG
ncbi:MAG: hypothetical protein KatS3mg008_0664 [Acidimicrobiales bacterium]|nr:MAG: hypothetical protein KatS3mg008_0664 [Acidimicrobiales bacterium]